MPFAPPEPAVLPPPRMRLAGHVLDVAGGRLCGPDGAEVPLRPKTFALLLLLARHRGVLVGRQRILDVVWSGVTVTDDNITQCIGELRRALGEEGGRLLRTVPRHGYVLAMEAEPAAAPVVAPPMVASPAVTPPVVAPAVCDAPAGPGGAAPRCSPRRPGVVLPVAAVLLLAGWVLWPAAGPPPSNPALMPPAPISQTLIPQTPAPTAQQWFEQGREIAYRGQGGRANNWLGARALFKKAIAAEPGFAAAYAEAAFTHTNMVNSGLSPDRAADLRQAEALAARAAALAPALPVVHAAQAAVLRLQRRPAEALEAYRRAVALDPRQLASLANTGLMLALLGRPEALAEPVLQALALAEANHPFTGTWLTYLGLAELQLGQGDFGAARFRRSLEREAFLAPDIRRLYLAAALALQGQAEAAGQLVRDVLARQPQLSAARLRQQELSDEPAYLARQANLYRGLALAGLPD